VTIGTGTRIKSKEHLNKPAPNAYYIQGDFDFKDPSKEKEGEEQFGKHPQFHFGMNNKVRDKNLDMPGPGEYSSNVFPSN